MNTPCGKEVECPDCCKEYTVNDKGHVIDMAGERTGICDCGYDLDFDPVRPRTKKDS